MTSMASRGKPPVIRCLRLAALALCLSVCASMVIGGCSGREEPQQRQETADQQKMRQEKRGD